MLDLIHKYNEKRKTSELLKDEIDKKIEKAEKQISRLEKKRDKIKSINWFDEIVKPLGEILSKKIGLPYEIYGPFGLECNTSIYFREDMAKGICEQPTKSIHLRPSHKEIYVLEIYYETGEKTNTYASGTIGDLNGMNNVIAVLPDTIEDIIGLLR